MRAITIILIFFSLTSCKAQNFTLLDGKYNLNKPDVFYTLSDTLLEISGLTDIDSAHVGCVQDEKGMIFIYNLFEARIVSHLTFYLDGDYEGITRVGDDMYVLRSDGSIFKVKNYMSGKSSLQDSIATGIPITNNEGLCYDEKNKRLLIAAKGKIKGDKDLRDTRFVYAYQIDSAKMIEKPILTFDLDDIANVMKTKNIDVTLVKKKNGEIKYDDLKFLPSSIAIHPTLDNIYILSAVDRLLMVINRSGVIEDIIKLDEQLFPKPEGITFLPGGDMLISNEGKSGKANLMRFNIKQ